MTTPMTTTAAPVTTGPATTTEHDLPGRRTLVGLSATYLVLFVALFLLSGGEIANDARGSTVIKEFSGSHLFVQVTGYGMVVAAGVVVFWGTALRRRLGGTWTADLVAAGALTMGLTLVGWVVTAFALMHAVDTGVPEVAQAVNILDNSNFVPAMLALTCMMIGAGLSGLRSGRLPRWLAVASIVLGVLAPLGPAAFLPFSLFPLWAVVVSTQVRIDPTR